MSKGGVSIVVMLWLPKPARRGRFPYTAPTFARLRILRRELRLASHRRLSAEARSAKVDLFQYSDFAGAALVVDVDGRAAPLACCTIFTPALAPTLLAPALTRFFSAS